MGRIELIYKESDVKGVVNLLSFYQLRTLRYKEMHRAHKSDFSYR